MIIIVVVIIVWTRRRIAMTVIGSSIRPIGIFRICTIPGYSGGLDANAPGDAAGAFGGCTMVEYLTFGWIG